MSAWVFAILALAAFVGSIVSAILGMAGGVFTLAVMLCFMPHGEAIPTHAVVQIASNGTRVLAFIRDVDYRALGRFVSGMVVGGAVGTLLLWMLGQPERSEPYLKTLIGAYVLVAIHLPKGKSDGDSVGVWWDFPLMGLVAGVAALTVGAIGPLIAPLFIRRDFLKERLIATKAVCQLATHIVKIPAFLWLRELDVGRLGSLALLMIVMVIPGTLIGKRILKDVPERHFRIAFQTVLTITGLKVLVFDGLRNIPIWS
jgi:uncharacterized membrane protein YfcA